MIRKTFLLLLTGMTMLASLALAQPGYAGQAAPKATTSAPVATATAAPTLTATPAAPAVDAANEVTFARLGANETTLYGPFDSFSLFYNLPANWALNDGAVLSLDVTSFFSSANGAATAGPSPAGLVAGSLAVVYNGQTLATLALSSSGDQSFQIPIPANTLSLVSDRGRHHLELLFQSVLECTLAQESSLVIRPTSHFAYPHSVVPQSTSLTKLPIPIYQSEYWPDQAALVVPDQPSAGELQAALVVASSFGNLTSGSQALPLIPASQVSDALRSASNLIVVGKGASLPLLGDVKLPAPLTGGKFTAAGSSPDDGILQEAVSPWSDSHVVLSVGGNSDAGVVKAAQALSAGSIRTGDNPALALVAKVEPGARPSAAPVDQTLADLGYSQEKFSGAGSSSATFEFFVPPGEVSDNDSYFELAINHSALLDYNRSSLTVALNNQPVGSLRFSDDTAKSGFSQRYTLPLWAFRPGTNRITVNAQLLPIDRCSNPSLGNLWLTIWPTSNLHLSLRPAPLQTGALQDLSRLPAPFTLDSSYANTAFVLPKDDPASWAIAAQLAGSFGQRSGGKLNLLQVYTADSVPDKLDRDLVVIGRASTLPFLASLKDALPAPFEPGSDTAIEKNFEITYRILPGVNLGYVELLASPWNGSRTILAILGNSPAGLFSAGSAVVDPTLQSRLSGNLAVIKGREVVSIDTRFGAGGVAAATLAPVVTVVAPQVDLTAVPDRPGWIAPTIAGAVVLMIVIVIAVAAAGIRRRVAGSPKAK